MKVHNTLGNGFQEVIYQRCLAIELSKADIAFEREKIYKKTSKKWLTDESRADESKARSDRAVL